MKVLGLKGISQTARNINITMLIQKKMKIIFLVPKIRQVLLKQSSNYGIQNCENGNHLACDDMKSFVAEKFFTWGLDCYQAIAQLD